jgi:uncharacterized membrane protein HdeD (DUF308 family)
MKPKVFWGWIVAAGILLAIIGGVLAFFPPVGLPIMGLGFLMMLVGIVMMIPILIKEMRSDDRDMKDNIKEEDLRP